MVEAIELPEVETTLDALVVGVAEVDVLGSILDDVLVGAALEPLV